MASADTDEDPTPYRLAAAAPPKRRYRPMKGFRASSEREPDPFDQPAPERFLGTDPFPWALVFCVIVWIGLGLAARQQPLIGFVLVGAGLLVCFASQVWLYVSICMQDREAGFFSMISGWYRLFYLYMNPELVWRPSILAGVGILLALTGIGLFLTHDLIGFPC